MDPLKRQRLEQRRTEMLAALRLRERCDRVRERTDVLDANGVPHGLIFDDRAQVDWIWRHFPRGGGLFSARIDWDRVPEREMGPESRAEDDEAVAWLARLAAERELEGEVVLVSGDGVAPAIRMAFEALASLPQVVTSGFDLWIVSEKGGWAIEFLRFEHGWWWGRASAAADGGG